MLGSSESAVEKKLRHFRPLTAKITQETCTWVLVPGGTALILMVSIYASLLSIRESHLNLDTNTVTWESQSTCNLYFQPWRHHWNLKTH